MCDLDLEPLTADVNKIILQHLKKIVDKFTKTNTDCKATMEMLNHLPIVKELQGKLRDAEAKISELTNQLASRKKVERVNLEISEIGPSNPGPTLDEIEKSIQTEVEKSEQKHYSHMMQHLPRYTFGAENNDSDAEDDDELHNVLESKYALSLEKLMQKQANYQNNHSSPVEDNEDTESDGEEEEEEEDEDAGDADDEKEDNGSNAERAEVEMEAESVLQWGKPVEISPEDNTEKDADVKEENSAEEDDVEDDTDGETEEEDDSEEELHVDEIVINDTIYYTDDNLNGSLFACLESGQVGDEVGHLENGDVFFS